MILIGLAGRAGCGKDTVGEILKDNHDFATTSFALPIKQMICVLLGVSLDQWSDRVWRETKLPFCDRSPRALAQTLGTEWGRHQVHQQLWLRLALDRIEEGEWDRFAITDLRFANEAQEIIRLGGYVIHVHRAGDEGAIVADRRTHESERGLPSSPNDFHINNFGTLEDLQRQVAGVVERILEIEAAKEEARKNEEVQSDDANSAGAND